MAWTSFPTWVVGQVSTASDWNTYVAANMAFLAGTTGAAVLTSQTTTSATYADLATVGPAVTVVTGVNAIVMVTANLNNTGSGSGNAMSYAVSGATTIAAADTTALIVEPSTANYQTQATFAQLLTGLTAGSNTFTAKYRTTANTMTASNRYIIVIPLP